MSLCSEHFSDDCFERDFKREFETKSKENIYKIKKDAIPTIFSHKSTPKPRRASKSRISRAKKRKLIDDTLATLPTESKEAAPENIFVPHNIIDEDDIGKYRDVGMNTDATFTPYCNVIFSISPTEHQISKVSAPFAWCQLQGRP